MIDAEGSRTPLGLKYQLERELRPFNREAVRQLPQDRTGVYALWLPAGAARVPDCLYVGMSHVCVRQRLLAHLSNETNPELRRQLHLFRGIAQFSAAFTEGRAQTLELEGAIIRDWQPETNRQKL